MPIYEYQCSACHHAFDVLQKMSDDAIKQCPECNQDTAVKLVSAAGFQLKGTGWYETDFKNNNKPSNTTSTAESSAKKTTKGSSD
ncbi:MAG: zinc ribbon domain-containing protein [Legionellaceae bacterium]|nr:zinc ribbon domain-containing protein [Legionellaceae bacterium]